jgi:hypothetical protein
VRWTLIIAHRATGDTLWSQIFGSSGIDEISQIISVNDSTFAFTGMKNNDFWIGSFVYKTLSSSAHRPFMRSPQNTVSIRSDNTFLLTGKKLSSDGNRNSSMMISEKQKKIVLK